HFNHSQTTPYISKKLESFKNLHDTLDTAFADLFYWIRMMLQHYLPEEYEVLLSVAEMLPGNSVSVVHPFLSLVININVVTHEHRDSKDKDYCAVIPIGNFIGGALVMKEPGLVVELD
ncbi:hypothetical protein DFH29DRAFT_776713, partial [Suillus ampliporus]